MRSRVDALLVAVLAVVAVLFWHERIIQPADRNVFGASDDPFTQIYPMWVRASAWWRAGQVPLWNPFQQCGVPFLGAVIYGVFYPAHVLNLVLPSEVAIEACAVLHQFLAGAFTYALARTLTLSPPAALLAALTYMLSGFTSSQAAWFVPAIEAAAWVPLVFLAMERIVHRPSRRWAGVFALGVAMPILAGWLQTWVYMMHAVALAAGLALVPACWRPGERRRAAHAAGLLVLAGGLGLALAAVQLLPSAELQALGPRRPGGLSLSQVLPMGPLFPQALLRQLLDGAPAFPRDFYLGMGTLILAPLALWRAAPRAAPVRWWMLLVFAGAICLTVFTPLFSWWLHVPGAGWFRFPYRMAVIVALAAAVLAGFGVDAIVQRRAGWGGAAMTVAGIGLVTAAWAAWAPVPEMGRTTLYVAAGAAAVAAVMPSNRWRQAAVLLLSVAVGRDLYGATASPALHPYHSLAPLQREDRVFSYVAAHQGLDRTYVAGGTSTTYATTPKLGTLREIYMLTDYEPLSLDRYGRYLRTVDEHGLGSPHPYLGFLDLQPNPKAVRALAPLSVRFVVVPRGAALARTLAELSPAWRYVATASSPGQMVFEQSAVLPRAYVAHAWSWAADEPASLAAVMDDGFDPWRTVVLEGTGGAPSSAAGGITPATIVTYEPTRVVVRADAVADGYLVLSDVAYPGWRAAVDGADAPIVRANDLFRGVWVAAGTHEIVFEYRPASVRVGAAVSLLALIGIVVLLTRREPVVA